MILEYKKIRGLSVKKKERGHMYLDSYDINKRRIYIIKQTKYSRKLEALASILGEMNAL